MSYIRSTLKYMCGKFVNVSTGSFGAGIPTSCPFCKKEEKYEFVSEGWFADENGGWTDSFERNLN